MKRALFLVLLCAAVLSVSGESRAQSGKPRVEAKYLRMPHRFQIFMDGGIALPSLPGVFNDYWNTAFSFGAGFGMSIQPWLEVSGNFGYGSFGLNGITAKGRIRYAGVQEVQGGAVKTTVLSASVRFLAVPKSRTNPYIEVGAGTFTTKADDVAIEDVLHNKMKQVSGISVAPAVGIQYAMNDHWSAYTKFTYMLNLNKDFAPGDLLRPANVTEDTVGDNQVLSSVVVGLMVRF